MTITEALECDSSRATADWIVKEIGTSRKKFRIALDACFSAPYPVSMRAARVVQLSCKACPAFVPLHIDEIIDNMPLMRVEGVRRGFMKLFLENLEFKGFDKLGTLANICFNSLETPKEGTALKYYAMRILYKISQTEPDLKPELIMLLQLRTDDECTSIRTCARKLIRKLQQEINRSQMYGLKKRN